MLRLRAETMPSVTEPPRPKGLPIAITQSPTIGSVAVAELDEGQIVAGVDLEDREIGLRVGADDLGRPARAVSQENLDLVGALDDVIVGDDDAVGADDEAGAEALRLLHRFPARGRCSG